jgi:hypothetical protein
MEGFMSGGAFEYKECQLDFLADEIIHQVEDFVGKPELQKHANNIVKRLRKLRKEIKRLDYYLSGDCSEYK